MIGVAISTRNRHHLLASAIRRWRRTLPGGAPLMIVDDASRSPVEIAAYRFEENVGIARTKNKGIELLMDAGVTDLFLADDDVWPIAHDWWVPYVEDPEPHLMLCWGRSRRLAVDDLHSTWSHPRGVLLYAERRVIDRVGGMRPEFGKWGSEHVEWSQRIHNAGFTLAPFQDVVGARALFHAEDWGLPGETHEQLARRRARNSAIPRGDRTPWKHRKAILQQHEGSTEFVDYRESSSPRD